MDGCLVSAEKRQGTQFGSMRFALIAVLMLAAILPAAAHAQTGAAPSTAVQNLTSTPAYPYIDVPAAPGSRVASVRKLLTVQTHRVVKWSRTACS